MVCPATYKSTCLDRLHRELFPLAETLYYDQTLSQKEKAAAMNKAVNAARHHLAEDLHHSFSDNTAALQVTLEYCITVVMLEYRNMVWPYNNMDLSRRVGELWERVCNAAWINPANASLALATPPSFDEVSQGFRTRLGAMIAPGMEQAAEQILHEALGLIGDVNMKGDGVFSVDGRPLTVDFKSGFGSNEKGNTDRLLRVGRAYKIWNQESRLLLLVRQTEHNNRYLGTLEASGAWEVHCGNDAYRVTREVTGIDLKGLFSKIVAFEEDFSPRFWERLRNAGQGLERYLDW